MTAADRVRIYEVGPRDGLQNEARPVPLATKLRYLELLADAGLREIEATSFVAPDAIPQLADADELMAALARRDGRPLSGPRPERPRPRSRRGGRCRCDRGLHRRQRRVHDAQHPDDRRRVARGLCARPRPGGRARLVATRLCVDRLRLSVLRRGRIRAAWSRSPCASSSSASRRSASATRSASASRRRFACSPLAPSTPASRSNASRTTSTTRAARRWPTSTAAMSDGIRCFDSSTGGTGGCPYAPGAAGNLATEDLVYLLDAHRAGARRRARRRPRRRPIHRRRPRQAARHQGRPGGRLGPAHRPPDGTGLSHERGRITCPKPGAERASPFLVSCAHDEWGRARPEPEL